MEESVYVRWLKFKTRTLDKFGLLLIKWGAKIYFDTECDDWRTYYEFKKERLVDEVNGELAQDHAIHAGNHGFEHSEIKEQSRDWVGVALINVLKRMTETYYQGEMNPWVKEQYGRRKGMVGAPGVAGEQGPECPSGPDGESGPEDTVSTNDKDAERLDTDNLAVTIRPDGGVEPVDGEEFVEILIKAKKKKKKGKKKKSDKKKSKKKDKK